MLRSFDKRPEHAAALDRVRAWTRERFTLAADAAILVSEVYLRPAGLSAAARPWSRSGPKPSTRHHFKLFKPVAEVVADDLPPAWLKNALVAIEGLGCECC